MNDRTCRIMRVDIGYQSGRGKLPCVVLQPTDGGGQIKLLLDPTNSRALTDALGDQSTWVGSQIVVYERFERTRYVTRLRAVPP